MQLRPGTVFAIPLADGQWTACQVVRIGEGTAGPCVVSLRWIGDARPALADLRDAAPLRLDHHRWKGTPDWCHVGGAPVPPSYVELGVLPPPDLGECPAYGGWTGGLHIRLQATWDALPAAV